MIQKIPLGSTSITEAGVPFRYINGENDETYIGDDDGNTIIHFGKLSVARHIASDIAPCYWSHQGGSPHELQHRPHGNRERRKKKGERI